MFQRNNRGNREGGGRDQRKRTSGPRGLFNNNVWHCDCEPRLPAEHFRVKKEGKNNGRWFYTCQQQEPQRCGFFLWDEDAKPREEAAVLSNSRNEPSGGMQEGWKSGRYHDTGPPIREHYESPTPPPSWTSEAPLPTGSKRTAQTAAIDLDGDGSADSFETPRKVRQVDAYPTPATTGKRKLPWQEAEPTTPANAVYHSEYFSTPSKQQQPQTPFMPAARSTAATPSPPTRHRDALNDPADDASSLTAEALACLASAKLPPDTLSKLRSILTKHDLKSQGITKGRDISRLALKAKEAKITELEARIASMSAEIDLERAGGG